MSDQSFQTFSLSRRTGTGTTYAERVYGFLVEHTPQPICDDCIAKATNIARENINQLTSILGLTSDFGKAEGTCAICKGNKRVTRSRRYA